MQKIQTLGGHHITMMRANRQASIGFWEGVSGMPFLIDRPNLDDANEGRLCFDPGDGRLITVFTYGAREPLLNRTPMDTGCGHSNYFKEPLGPLIKLACYIFVASRGSSFAEVMLKAHKLSETQGGEAIERVHLADAAVAILEQTRGSLSADRGVGRPSG